MAPLLSSSSLYFFLAWFDLWDFFLNSPGWRESWRLLLPLLLVTLSKWFSRNNNSVNPPPPQLWLCRHHKLHFFRRLPFFLCLYSSSIPLHSHRYIINNSLQSLLLLPKHLFLILSTVHLFLHFDWLFSTFIDTKSFLRAFFPNCISSVFFVISRTNLLFLLLLTLLATISDSRTTLHHCRLFNRQFKKFQYFSSYSSLLAVELLQTSSMLLPNNNTVFYRWCALDDWKMSHHPSNLLYDIGTDPISIWRSAATVFGVFLNELL